MTGVTLDAGALIALDRGNRAGRVLLERARAASIDVVVPATVLAQVIRSPRRQARIMRLLAASTTHIADLDRVDATRVGRLLAESGTSDITDAHVVVTARKNGQTVITSDPDDLRQLDPELTIEAI